MSDIEQLARDAIAATERAVAAVQQLELTDDTLTAQTLDALHSAQRALVGKYTVRTDRERIRYTARQCGYGVDVAQITDTFTRAGAGTIVVAYQAPRTGYTTFDRASRRRRVGAVDVGQSDSTFNVAVVIEWLTE